MTSTALTLSPEMGLSHYLAEVRKFPMLSKQQEQKLANSWYYDRDRQAAHTIVTSHLRLVVKIAAGYKGYGLPFSDLISEGNVGLMQAVKKFDPRKGFRVSTYAMWWIKASIQEFILKSWSLVKVGTTAGQKKLFFNLRKLKGQMEAYEDGDLSPAQVTEIATTLDVSEEEVVSMNRRMAGGDHSLNAPLKDDTGSNEWMDMLQDETQNQEAYVMESDETSKRQGLLNNALVILNERERAIFTARRLSDEPLTLEDLSQKYAISRERVRQIENRAYEKVQKAVTDEAAAANLL